MKSVGIVPALIATLLSAMPASPQSQYAKLRPSGGYWERNARRVPVHITRLSQHRKLATVGDSLYMLNAGNRVVWTWSSGGAPLTDLPIIDSKGTIYVIGYDLLWAALDSATGKVKWHGTAGGRSVYSQIKLYREDTYLVVTDMQGYKAYPSEEIEDHLTLCRGNAILWETRIPARARIEVRGGQVFTRIKRRGSFVRRVVKVPRQFGEPVGRVSVLAEY